MFEILKIEHHFIRTCGIIAESISTRLYRMVFDCGVCTELFDDTRHNPRVIPCGHTICEVCVRKLFTGLGIRCPICRQYFGGVRDALDYPKNFCVIRELTTTEITHKCIEHNEPFHLFDTTCGMLVCVMCITTSAHKGHEYTLPRDVCVPIKPRNCRDAKGM